MGWVGVGWLGWVLFGTFWVWCWGYFSFLNIFDHQILHAWCMRFKLFLFCFVLFVCFKFLFNQVHFLYLCNLCNTDFLRVLWGLVGLFFMFSLPHQTQVQVNKNFIKTKKMYIYRHCHFKHFCINSREKSGACRDLSYFSTPYILKILMVSKTYLTCTDIY